MNSHVAARGRVISLREPNPHAVNVPPVGVRVEDVDAVKRIANLVNRNQENARLVSQAGTRDLRGMRNQLGIQSHHGRLANLGLREILTRSASRGRYL